MLLKRRYKLNIKKIMSFVNVFSIANISVLLIYNFEKSRHFIKNIIVAIFNEELATNINDAYLTMLPILKLLIYIYIIFIFIVVMYKIIKYYINRFKQRKEAMQASGINKDLYDYLNNYDKKCFVITGDWGVGKTYTVDNFLDRYFKYENRDVYRISCFGMENRKDVLEELKNIFEKQDKSLRKYIINILNKVPIIGGLLEDALKSDYEFKDLKERSIFIFDDLERINIPKYQNIYTREWYRVKNIKENARVATPLNEIYKEFKEVERAFGEIDNSLKNIKEEINIEKFNVITGLVNELIERYNMKVIVICNKEEIDKNFFYDVFECKIESIMYKIKTEHDVTANLAKRNINNKLYLEKNIKKEIEEFFIDNAQCIDNVWAKNNISNVRILSKSISAFIEIVENYNIEKVYYRDLFFTILITYIADFTGEISYLESIEKGEMIKAFYEKHILMLRTDNPMAKKGILYIISSEPDTYNIRWMGLDLGTAWSIGIHNYEGIREELEIYDNYNYEEEKNIFCINKELVVEKGKTYKFDNLIYLLKTDAENIDKILKIMKEGNVDYTSHTSFRYGSTIFANIYDKKDADKSEIIFSILNAYQIDDTNLFKIFEKLKDVIDMSEIKKQPKTVGMNMNLTIQDKYIKFLEEKDDIMNN